MKTNQLVTSLFVLILVFFLSVSLAYSSCLSGSTKISPDLSCTTVDINAMLQSGDYQRKVDNFIIIEDATSSMRENVDNSSTSKLTISKGLIRCLNNTTAVLFEFPGYEMSDVREYSEIVYHTGGESDDILELSIAGNKSVLGLWRGFRAIPFVRKLFDKQSLAILATAKNGTDLEASFDISGIETSITKLRNTCEW